MFSENAKAFNIENLLGLKLYDSKEIGQTEGVGEICPVPGQGTQCVHNAIQTVNDDIHASKISIELCQSDLWHSFHGLGTEMIITKSGRRMFPAVRCKLQGLEPKSKYRIYLDFVQLDRHKYRYVYHSSKWMVSGTGDNMIKQQTYSHPDCPIEGNLLNSQIISFERLKLTNNDRSRNGQISLLSMQRFLPRIHVEKLSAENHLEEHYVTSFLQTSFMAVTAYQNQEITRLKIARNPFAKGFRESGKNRSSLEAMIECYGLQLNESEHNSRYRRQERNLSMDHALLSPVIPVTPQSTRVPAIFQTQEKPECLNVVESPDQEVKLPYHRYLSLDSSYDFCCNKNVHIIHEDNVHTTTDIDSFRYSHFRPSPYIPTCYTHFSVKPKLKVLHYDAS